MKFSSKSAQYTGYHYNDVILSITLISKDKDTFHTELAKACGLSPSAFSHYLNKHVIAYKPDPLQDDIDDAYRIPSSRNSAAPAGYSLPTFKERDLATIANMLGRACDGAFSSIPGMIAYAQQHYSLADGARWIKTDYPDEQALVAQKQGIAKLPLYKAAMNLLLTELNTSIIKLAHDPADVSFGSYLANKMTSVSPEYKFTKMKRYAGLIGEKLGVENMTPDMMLEHARAKWPEQIPADDTLPEHKRGGYGGR